MTSNQVAYEVGIRNLEETTRHNQTTESIQQQLADLEKQKLDFQDEWKKKDQYLTQSYNEAYLQYLNSSQDWKKHYESQLASIEQEKADADVYYKGIIAGIDQDKANISRYAAEETKRANLASEELRSTQNWLTSKQIEYNQTATLLQSTQAEAKLAQDLLIARENQEVQYAKIAADQAAANANIKMRNKELAQKYVQTTADVAIGATGLLIKAFDVITSPLRRGK